MGVSLRLNMDASSICKSANLYQLFKLERWRKLKGQQASVRSSTRKARSNQAKKHEYLAVISCLLYVSSYIQLVCTQEDQQSLVEQAQNRALHSLSTASSTHLSQYNQVASSSSFGEPVFRLEPPSVIEFANWQGATLPCLASGSPRPTIAWFSSASSNVNSYNLDQGGQPSGYLQSSSAAELTRPVGNVTNLRQILNGGATLRLLPFEEADYRPEVHSTEYTCVASNDLGSVHSRSVFVQAGELKMLALFR